MSLRLAPWLLAALLGWAGAASAQKGAGAAAFERLKALQGHWEGQFEDGRKHTVEYRLSAGGTVLVETWQLAPGRESMTLYHLDEMTIAEIATVTGLAEGTIKSHLFRTRKQLRVLLEAPLGVAA